jgi:hypothetical protein
MLKTYAKLDAVTNAPLQTIMAPDDDLADILNDGSTYVSLDDYPMPENVSHWDIDHWVERSVSTDASHLWNPVTHTWFDPRTLAGVKVAKNSEINAARASANQTVFYFQSHPIQVDALSRSDIDGVNGAVALNGVMPTGWVGGWKTADNSFVSIPDVATWKDFYQAMVAQGQTNFAHSESLKALLVTATTIAEVEAIVW